MQSAYTGNCITETCTRGVIGSRTRLRIWRREAWGFESLRVHRRKEIGAEEFFCLFPFDRTQTAKIAQAKTLARFSLFDI